MHAMRGISGAFGELVATSKDKRVSKFGIMNASRLPLQAVAYRENGADHRADIPAWSQFKRCLSYIRGAERLVTDRNEAALVMERAIVQDLKRRLCDISVENDLLIVCCGALAQRFFERTQMRAGVRIVYAPHPSPGPRGVPWRLDKYADCIRTLYADIAHAIR